MITIVDQFFGSYAERWPFKQCLTDDAIVWYHCDDYMESYLIQILKAIVSLSSHIKFLCLRS